MMICVKRHTKLQELKSTEIGWSHERVLAPKLGERLSHTRCIELRIGGLKPTRAPYEPDKERLKRASDKLDEILALFLVSDSGSAHLVCFSNFAAKNRVRTYKGFFAPGSQIRRGDFHQAEIERNGKSYFIGIAQITETNRIECLHLARRNGFVLFSNRSESLEVWRDLRATFDQAATFAGVRMTGRILLNYSHLVVDLVHGEQWIARYGFDRAGADWMNLAFFVGDSIEQRIKDKIEAHLDES